jgi:2-polyprenyl-6-methoxyphenol hydroxylase-like FAD-dependent oxidoreductase
MAPSLDICVRGAGIVGRTLALLLARDRLRVGLVEGPPPAAADVRAYALNAASRQLLESLRAWPDPAHATAVLGMQVHGDDGGMVRFDAGPREALAWIVDVPALEQRLAQAVAFQPQVQLLAAPAPATLTVVCEGRDSATRAELGVEHAVQRYGQHAVAARLDCEVPHGQVARQWFCGGEVVALLPLAERQVALVWSVRQERSGELLQCDPGDFAARVQRACQGALGAMALVGERACWPLQTAQARRWSGPGWVLAGDAAHSVHPLAGQGLNLGLADARELAAVLHGRDYWRSVADPRLLRRYERARKAALLAVGGATDTLQQLFVQEHPAFAALRNWGMRGFDRSGPLKDWVVRQAAGRL